MFVFPLDDSGCADAWDGQPGRAGGDWCAKNVEACKEEAPANSVGGSKCRNPGLAHSMMIDRLLATQGCSNSRRSSASQHADGSMAAGWKWR